MAAPSTRSDLAGSRLIGDNNTGARDKVTRLIVGRLIDVRPAE
jgi:hypothetical protein